MGHILYSYQEKVYLTLKKYKSFALLVIVLALASSIYFTFSSNLYTANHLRFVISSLVLLLALASMIYPIVDKITLRFRKGFTYYIYLSHSVFIILAAELFIIKWEMHWIYHNMAYSLLYMLGIFLATFLFSILLVSLIELIHSFSKNIRQTSARTNKNKWESSNKLG